MVQTRSQTRAMATKLKDLPAEMIAEIFEHLDMKARLEVRAVCRQFQDMIESHTGISALIGDTGYHYLERKGLVKSEMAKRFEFHAQVSIRKAIIVRLDLLDFLSYPFTLNEVKFGSQIPNVIINNILHRCRNLCHVTICPTDIGSLAFGDVEGQLCLLPKLKSLKFLEQGFYELFFRVNATVGAHNSLVILKQIRASSLQVFTLCTYWTPSFTKILADFLFFHVDSLNEFSLSLVDDEDILHPDHADYPERQQEMQNFTETVVEPFYQNKEFHQKTIHLIGLQPVEFLVLYPFLRAQRSIEEFKVREAEERVNKLDWLLFQPIFANNPNIRSINLKIECETPIDLSHLQNLALLRELYLSGCGDIFYGRSVRAINCHQIPADVETLVFTSVLLDPEQLEELSRRLKKIRVFMFVCDLTRVDVGALSVRTVRNFLHCRTLQTLLLMKAIMAQDAEREEWMNMCLRFGGLPTLIAIG